MSIRKIIKEFLIANLIMGPPIGLVLAIKHPARANNAFVQGIAIGFCFSLLGSLWVLIRFLLFQKRWLHFSNMSRDLRHLKVENITRESLAVDASLRHFVVGGLFLGADSLVFIPHRFAFGRVPLSIPLSNIASAEIEDVNILKFASGGLRKRLAVSTREGSTHELTVWDPEGWRDQINSSFKDSRSQIIDKQ